MTHWTEDFLVGVLTSIPVLSGLYFFICINDFISTNYEAKLITIVMLTLMFLIFGLTAVGKLVIALKEVW